LRVGRHALLFAEHGFVVETVDAAAAGLDFARRETAHGPQRDGEGFSNP
jgi:hypothetical protein